MTTAQSIGVDVTTSYWFDPFTNLWSYNYTVTNPFESTNVIDMFAISPVAGVATVSAPAHWSVFPGYQGNPVGIVWAVTDSYNYVPGPGDGLSPPPSPYALLVGAALDGFFVVSLSPPGYVTAYVDEYRPFLRDSIDVDEGDPFAVLDPTIWEVQTNTGPVMIGPGGPPATAGVGGGAIEGGLPLERPFPNPARGEVALRCNLAKPAHVRLTIHDISGREIRELVNIDLEKGVHSWIWDGSDGAGRAVVPGVYFVWLVAGGHRIASQRVVIVR